MFINKFSMIKQYQYPILLTLKLTSGNKIIFQNYQIKIQRIFNKNQINIQQYNFPTQYHRFSILRSPHVYKKSIETFETRVYSSQYKFIIYNYSTYYQLFHILKFLTKNIPSSINLTIKLSNNVKTNI